MKYCSRRYCILLGFIMSILVCACFVPEKKIVDDGILWEIPWAIEIEDIEKTEISVSEEVLNYVELMTIDKTGYYGFYEKDEAGELFDIESVCMNVKNSLNSFLPLD